MLESVIDITWIIVWVGRFGPMPVGIEDVGKLVEQRPERSIDRMGGTIQAATLQQTNTRIH